MLMRDYLKVTSDAFGTLAKAIRSMKSPMERLQRERQLLQQCEDYLNDNDSDGRGYAAFSYVSDNWGKELTLTDAAKFLRGVDERILANGQSVRVLCGSMLMIAQNGVKLVLGPPSKWKSLRGQVRSIKGECVLDTIWHGRNQFAHVEGLTIGGESDLYFKDLERRLGSDFAVSTNGEVIPELLVRDVLGWLENESFGYRSSRYLGDMMALGGLVGR